MTVERQNQAPYPRALPGDFCVLRYQPLWQTFRLSLDDADLTTYNLGSDLRVIRRLFTAQWGVEFRRAERLVDVAREYRAAMLDLLHPQHQPVAVKDEQPTTVDPFRESAHATTALPKPV